MSERARKSGGCVYDAKWRMLSKAYDLREKFLHAFLLTIELSMAELKPESRCII